MLSHYRVVDLCSGISQFAGYLLASLGAEVIAVEPPGGTRTRHVGPFVDDVADPQRSLMHWAYNQGKKSITLDVDDPDDFARLLELVATADALIEDADRSRWGSTDLDYARFESANPALVHTTITPYGSFGPRSGWAGSDLTAVAGSGFLHASGDRDRPPVRVSAVPQSFLQAAGDAAAATLIALYEAQRSGRGQHVDVSAMESMTHGQPQNLAPRVNSTPINRIAGGLSLGGIDIPMLFECADGHTVCVALMGAVFAGFSRRLVAWEDEEGFADDELRGIDWENFGVQVLSGEVSPDVAARAFATHARFLAGKTKAELWAAAFERNVLVTPSATVGDLLTNDHFEARGFWHDVELDDGRTARFAGPLAHFSEGQPAARSPVPRPGEHDGQIDMTRKPTALAGDPSSGAAASGDSSPAADPSSGADPATAPSAGAAAAAPSAGDPSPAGADPLPLAGLHVLEFSWVIATPSAVRILADYGATVVKVETESRPDTMRTVNPFVDEEAHPDNSVGYGVYNAGKRSISLDLDKPESRDVVLDLVRWADVATESFAPGAFDRMGYGYDVVSEVNPRLVLLSSSLLGRTGPSSGLAGYGFMAAAIAGFYELAGWPDRGPAGPYGPYTDYLAPRVVVASLMAALEQRRRTGRGCHIDLSQTETALHYLSPAILDAAVNGRTAQRCGNDDPQMSPHGVFPSAGDDAWVAVACADGMWPALAGVVGLDSLAGLTQAQRRERADEIAAAVSAWTSEHGNDAAARLLQGAGVDAYPVNNAQGCCDDPQLSHRNHHIDVPQSHRGTMWTHNCRTTMSRTPPQVWRGGPCLGEDNFEVLSDFLGYDGDRIADLAAAEVLG